MNKIRAAASFLEKMGLPVPDIGIVLGTGLGELQSLIENSEEVPYSEIPHFPVSTVESHKGMLVFGKVNNVNVVAMSGRFHFYEGYSMKQVTFPIRVLQCLGIKILILSNASGSTHPGFETGDIALIRDHINLHHENPLRGGNLDELGPRFPDLENAYDRRLRELAQQEAAVMSLDLKEAVYVSVPGPNLETLAEFKYFRIIGGDIVGMSTVPEVIVANHMGIPVLAFSIVTNEGWPEDRKKATVEEIIEVAGSRSGRLQELVFRIIPLLDT